MYRPQFAYQTPPGCRDEEFAYFFDGSNTPMLAQDLDGKTVNNIPLVLQQDAPFYWRGIKVQMPYLTSLEGDPPVFAQFIEPAQLFLKFQDCYQNDLSGGFLRATEYGFGQNPWALGANAVPTGPPMLLDPEIYCPAGGYILLSILAGSTGNNVRLEVALLGVKRFRECDR